MPARQKPTLVELMIIMAILGILASIAIPQMEQAKRRALRSQQVRAEGSAASDGQLNTVEVSPLAQSGEQPGALRWVGVLIGLLPIAVAVVVLMIILGRFRDQMTRHRAR